jgi:hypothetical protein
MVGNSNAAGGFIDTGYDLHGWDPHVYVSVLAVQEMARMIGWVPPGTVSGNAAEAARLEARIAELETDIAEKDAQLAAVHTLKQAGYAPSKRVGRPPKEKVA